MDFEAQVIPMYEEKKILMSHILQQSYRLINPRKAVWISANPSYSSVGSRKNHIQLIQ